MSTIQGLIHARFDLVGKTPDHNMEIHRCNVPTIPSPGEIINLKGNPFVVTMIRWAAPDGGPDAVDDGVIYAYVDVVKYKRFDL